MKRSCFSDGAMGIMRKLTRCLSAHKFGLRAGIAFAGADAGLRTPGSCEDARSLLHLLH